MQVHRGYSLCTVSLFFCLLVFSRITFCFVSIFWCTSYSPLTRKKEWRWRRRGKTKSNCNSSHKPLFLAHPFDVIFLLLVVVVVRFVLLSCLHVIRVLPIFVVHLYIKIYRYACVCIPFHFKKGITFLLCAWWYGGERNSYLLKTFRHVPIGVHLHYKDAFLFFLALVSLFYFILTSSFSAVCYCCCFKK